MSYVNWQDPGTREIRSTDISGLQEIVSKLERSVGMETVSETDIPLTEVYISENDRWRIFQAPEGKRNWVSEPAPVIKRDGVPIDIGFVIDYGAGAIILTTNDTEEHTYTADATYIKSLQTSLNEELATHLADIVHTDEVNSTVKYPSAAVTYQHGQEIDEINSKLSVFSFLRTSKNFTPNDTMEIPVLKGRTAYLVLMSQGGFVTQAQGAYIVYTAFENFEGTVLPLKDSSCFSVQYISGSGTIFIKNTYSGNLEIAISVIRIL